MKSRMYWGVAILIILLIGVYVFLITRPTETEPKIVYKPLTLSEKAEVDRNIQDAIDKAKKDMLPIAEIEHQEMPHKNSQRNDDAQSNASHEDQPLTPLTSTELDELYQQMSTEISQMKSEEELDNGLDLTQYTPRQRSHLLNVGIDLSLLPDLLAERIIVHQRRKKGLPPLPKKGEVVLHNLTKTPSGGVTFTGAVEPLPGETVDEAYNRMIQEALKQANMLPANKEGKQ